MDIVSVGTTAPTLLRLVTCGSVDDGKSTLIGRLLLDAGLVPEDQAASLSDGSPLAPARLLDGLVAEREQGITIDVGHRIVETARRRLRIADAPGHDQYTRNMATAASSADLAIILVDATRGVSLQTRRHTAIAALMGIRHVVLAVNKMDLVGHDAARFAAIVDAHAALALRFNLAVTAIPLSALHGDNVVRRSERMPWYGGPTLLHHLETVGTAPRRDGPFRLAVQQVIQAGDFRGLAGSVLDGTARCGDPVLALPSRRAARIARIVAPEGDVAEAATGRAVTIVLDTALDIGRGDMVAAADRPAWVADRFAAHLVWLDEAALVPGRRYGLRLGTAAATATIGPPRHRLDIDSGSHQAAHRLEVNEIGLVEVTLDRPLPFDAYDDNRDTGGFVLVDRETGNTVAAGMVRQPVRRADSLVWQDFAVDAAARAALKGHRPAVLWFTGLPGAGKSTVADAVERRLAAAGRHTYLLDGDNVRHGLNRDLGFSDADRVENIRRVVETARLMADAGLIVLVSFISPFRAERQLARERLSDRAAFLEIFVDTPLEACEARDPKGHYARARSGQLPNFTGIGSPYEPPESADIRLPTLEVAVDRAADLVVEALRGRGVFD
jgi:bifunctional enzyme CysN/CysC